VHVANSISLPLKQVL